jgi:MOSC domain-containing protein YiiM
MEGDRYANNIGTYSVLKEPGRQLTLLSADGVEVALKEEGKQLGSIGSLRRNIVLRGISSSELLQAIGSVVQFEGQTASSSSSSSPPQLFIHRNCVPW